jgi:hypothetical protein
MVEVSVVVPVVEDSVVEVPVVDVPVVEVEVPEVELVDELEVDEPVLALLELVEHVELEPVADVVAVVVPVAVVVDEIIEVVDEVLPVDEVEQDEVLSAFDPKKLSGDAPTPIPPIKRNATTMTKASPMDTAIWVSVRLLNLRTSPLPIFLWSRH